jgi:hypothetical protein
MSRIAICGALFTARPQAYASTAFGQHCSDGIHISSIPNMRSSIHRRVYQPTDPAMKKQHLKYVLQQSCEYTSGLSSW